MSLERGIEDRPCSLTWLWLLLTCLATSYGNLAAPLVCLDLLGHVHVENFPRDRVPRQILFLEEPGRLGPLQSGWRYTERIGASPEAREWQENSCR